MTAYEWFSYDDISKQMAFAVVAAEDQNFPFHFGFDFEQIEKAIEQSNRGRKLRGASTITRQVAKNLFIWEEEVSSGKDLKHTLPYFLSYYGVKNECWKYILILLKQEI